METVAEKEQTTTECDFYKVKEAAVILRMCDSTVRTYIKAGVIPCLRIGSAWRIPKKWIDDNRDNF